MNIVLTSHSMLQFLLNLILLLAEILGGKVECLGWNLPPPLPPPVDRTLNITYLCDGINKQCSYADLRYEKWWAGKVIRPKPDHGQRKIYHT